MRVFLSMNLRVPRSFASLTCLALLTACGGVTENSRVGSVELTPSSATVRTGNSLPLTAAVRDASGRQVSIGGIFWSSSDTSIAVVSSSGVVTARKAGTAKVAASTAGMSGTATITVSDRDVASVQVQPAALSVRVGATGPLEARTFDAQGGELTGRVIAWTTSASTIATVNAEGIVAGLSAGTATITATSEGRSGSAVVTITSVPVATVVLTPSLDTLSVSESVTLSASTRDASGAVLSGRTITFSSANTGIATVASNGQVVAVSPGSVVITATSEGRSATSTIVVLARPVAAVSVTPQTNFVTVGNSAQLTARLTDSQGTVLTGRTLTWTSSSNAIATVDGSGRVTAVGPGNALITATSEGKSGTATIVVSAIPVATVTVTPSTGNLFTGSTLPLTATARSASGAVLDGRIITWTTGAQSVATVSSAGVVFGREAGTVIIFADIDGVRGSATITVTVPPVASITVTPSDASIGLGGTVQLTATLKDAAGNTLTGRSVTWTSSNDLAAFVTSSGSVRGFLPGTATITATSEGISGTARVTVR